MTIFFNNFKILCLAHFWSIFLIFGAKNFFLENLALSRSAMDRPYFIGPFRLPPGNQNYLSLLVHSSPASKQLTIYLYFSCETLILFSFAFTISISMKKTIGNR